MGSILKDVQLKDNAPSTVLFAKHVEFLIDYGRLQRDTYEAAMTDYLKMSGMYWCVTALTLMKKTTPFPHEDIVAFIRSCQDPECGGFSASPGHDPHLLYTLSAIQILAVYDALDAVDNEKVCQYVAGLQNEDGSFSGDKWGEVDSRFSFCAVATLALLKKLDCLVVGVDKAVEYVKACMNFDGGFGSRPQSESHAGLIFCCVGFLSIVGRLDVINRDNLAWWLCERQLPSGGLNGRPEKLPDVCYSWWVLSSLKVLGRLDWIDKQALVRYIMACQDAESGGFADRPGDISDPYHTLFGLAGLSLLGSEGIEQVDPVFCMPRYVLDKMQVDIQLLE